MTLKNIYKITDTTFMVFYLCFIFPPKTVTPHTWRHNARYVASNVVLTSLITFFRFIDFSKKSKKPKFGNFPKKYFFLKYSFAGSFSSPKVCFKNVRSESQKN